MSSDARSPLDWLDTYNVGSLLDVLRTAGLDQDDMREIAQGIYRTQGILPVETIGGLSIGVRVFAEITRPEPKHSSSLPEIELRFYLADDPLKGEEEITAMERTLAELNDTATSTLQSTLGRSAGEIVTVRMAHHIEKPLPAILFHGKDPSILLDNLITQVGAMIRTGHSPAPIEYCPR